MCGFVGWVNQERDKPIDYSVLKSMNRALIHRGPNDEGYFIKENVGIGHRRLSIIDLSAQGRQPIFNEDKSVLVVLNGEIYNYKKLKEELIESGHRFATNTDTEVIVHAYEKWGIDCLNKLDGMFSLALYDMPNQKIVLAKDPFGKKPLYYTLQNGMLLFASEMKAFFKNPDFNKSLDLSSASKYLAYEYVPTPHCIFDNCKKLPAASYLKIDTQQLHQIREPIKYWDVKYEPKLKISIEDASDEILSLLRQAVQKRLMSDVPLGVFLSGGIDSSSIVALMTEFMTPENIKTFNIGFSEKSFDESGYAQRVADHFGTDHHVKRLHPDTMIDTLFEIIKNIDEPFADPSIIPTHLLSKFTKEYVTVAIGGDGGDELFAGYDPFTAMRFAPLFEHIPSLILEGARRLAKPIRPSEKNMGLHFKIKHFLKGFVPYCKDNLELRNTVWLGSFSPNVIKSLLVNGQSLCTDYETIYKETLQHKELKRAVSSVDRMIDNFISLYLHDDILVKVDRASMLVSLEVRAPFLDKYLSEFVNRLPSNIKMNGFNKKYLLKKSMKNILPKGIAKRAKKGFGIPLAKWFNGPLKEILMDTFSEHRMNQSGLFNSKWVRNLIEEHIKQKNDNAKELWTLLVFELWRKKHNIG